jgi:cytochrome P450
MTDGELRDEMFTLLMAGHETTATSLAWVFWHMLRHPDVLAGLATSCTSLRGITFAPSGGMPVVLDARR